MERTKKLADILVNYSIKVKKGDTILIFAGMEGVPLAQECSKLIVKKGAVPKVNLTLPGMEYYTHKNTPLEQLDKTPKVALLEMKNSQGVILIWSSMNTKELTNIDPKRITLRNKAMKPIHEVRSKMNNWVGVGYPSLALAQDAEMSLEEFEDFVFNATNVDWKKESKKQDKIKALVDRTNDVRIVGKDTDLTFSIKGLKGVKCDGNNNMPDGEVFTAPIKKSVNGHIYYEFPTVKYGTEFQGIRLWFKDGKVIKATSEKNEKTLKAMLDTDSGSRYLGEFGIGLNYNIQRGIKQILFDEKIGGTIHLALGKTFDECDNGNRSAIHWDMIKDLRKDGKVFFDNKLVMKDGKWLI